MKTKITQSIKIIRSKEVTENEYEDKGEIIEVSSSPDPYAV